MQSQATHRREQWAYTLYCAGQESERALSRSKKVAQKRKPKNWKTQLCTSVCAVREPPAVYHTLHTKVHTPYALTQGASAHAARAARAAEALSGACGRAPLGQRATHRTKFRLNTPAPLARQLEWLLVFPVPIATHPEGLALGGRVAAARTLRRHVAWRHSTLPGWG